MRIFAFILGFWGLLFIAPNVVQAHTVLDHASPRVGSTVATAPTHVTLWFTEKLEPAFSGIEVRNDSGEIVSAGKAQVDSANRTQLSVSLKTLSPGTYKVNWRVLSVDTHRMQGNFTFRVAP